MRAPGRVVFLCALSALLLGGAAAGVATNGHNVTALVHMSRRDALAKTAAAQNHSFRFVKPIAHYDGVYYYAIARDPLARGREHMEIDRASYHYGHPGYGWLAWALSGGGRPRLVPYALLVTCLLGLAAAAACASILAADLGMSAWWGLSVACNPGLLFAATVDTSETVGAAFALLTLIAWLRRRWLLTGVAVVGCCLTKEPLFALPVGLALWELLERRRGRGSSSLSPRLAALVVGPLVYAGWLAWCRHRFGVFPFSESKGFDVPVATLIGSLREEARISNTVQAQAGLVAVPLLLGVIAAIVVGAIRARRLRREIDVVYVLFALMAISLTDLAITFPKDMIRELAVTLAFLPFVLFRPAGGENVSAA